jgi:molecular chaperone DnaJ
MKDYYQTLGIEKNASKDDIKKAFRKLAHQYHPDKKGGNESKFKEVNEAYGILSDDKKRAEYDAYGRVFSGAGGSEDAGFGGFDFSQFSQGFNQNGFEFDLGDIFSEFFGGGKARTPRGRDISIDLNLTFEESIFGVERDILLNKVSSCDTCKGTGARSGSSLETCSTCNGNGKVKEVRRSIVGSFTTTKICETCNGTGKIPKEKCETCGGKGVLKKDQDIKVKIPSGIDDGEVVRLSSMGEAVSRGTAGDLYIKIHVSRHPIYRREGNNLVMTLNIKLTDALLGAKYAIKTLDGNIELKVPKGLKFGEILRIKGKGVPSESGRRGDILVKVKIDLPQKLSKKAEETIEKLREEGV